MKEDSLQSMVPYREKKILLSSGNIALQYVGDPSKPLLVCLHGWLDNGASFQCLANALDKDFQLLLIDLPGHGLSDPLPLGAHYYIWQYVEVLYELLEKLELDTANLIGHSMGGIVSSLFAGTFPDRVASLILLDSLGPVVSFATQAPDQLAKAIKEMSRPNSGLKVFPCESEALTARKKSSVGMTDHALMPIVLRNLKPVEGGFSWCTDKRLRQSSKVRLTEEQLRAFYASITAPVLVVFAEKGIIPEAWKEKRLAYFKNNQSVHLPGHHHFHCESEFVDNIAKQVIHLLNVPS